MRRGADVIDQDQSSPTTDAELDSQGRHYGTNNLRRRPPVQRVTVGGDMSKSLLVSVVEDDRSFRDSMSMLLSSFGYNVEAFASAGDFLASHRVSETACL